MLTWFILKNITSKLTFLLLLNSWSYCERFNCATYSTENILPELFIKVQSLFLPLRYLSFSAYVSKFYLMYYLSNQLSYRDIYTVK